MKLGNVKLRIYMVYFIYYIHEIDFCKLFINNIDFKIVMIPFILYFCFPKLQD